MQRVLTKVKELNLPVDHYLVVGGSALECYGIREAGDIDLMVTPQVFDELRSKGWEEIVKSENFRVLQYEDFEVATDFCYGNYHPTPESQMETAVIIEGVPVINLKELILYKRELGRKKDFKDIQLIENYLSSHPE